MHELLAKETKNIGYFYNSTNVESSIKKSLQYPLDNTKNKLTLFRLGNGVDSGDIEGTCPSPLLRR